VPPASRLRLPGLLLAGLAVYGGLAVSSLRTTSAVYDETAHLPAGYTYLTLGDFRMNPEHPPLAKELAALPLLLMDVRMQLQAGAWRLCREWDFGHRFLYEWNDADRLLLWGRLPIVALGGALAAAVLLWARRRCGPVAGTVAFFLCVLSPDVLAHGQVVTTDLAVTLFLFLTVVAFQAVTERATPARVLFAGLSAGAAFASKFSGLPYPDLLAALAVAAALLGPVALILGVAPRITALLLIGFTLVASLISHAFWTFPAEAQAAQQTQFFKNLAIVGGLLFYFVSGAGAFSLPSVLGSRKSSRRIVAPAE